MKALIDNHYLEFWKYLVLSRFIILLIFATTMFAGCMQSRRLEEVVLYDEDGREVGCLLPPISCEGKSVAWLLGHVQTIVQSRLKRDFRYSLLLRDQEVVRLPEPQIISGADLVMLGKLPNHPANIGPIRKNFPGGPLYLFHEFLWDEIGYWVDVNTLASDDSLSIRVGAPELLQEDHGRLVWVRDVVVLSDNSVQNLSLLPRCLPPGGIGAAYDPEHRMVCVVAPQGAGVFSWLRGALGSEYQEEVNGKF